MRLKWEPSWELSKTLQSIIEWHQSWLNGVEMRSVTLGQIDDYEANYRNLNESRPNQKRDIEVS